MSVPPDNQRNDFQNFSSLSARINVLFYSRSENIQDLMTSLDGLNSINYRQGVLTSPTKVILLVNQCCTLSSTSNPILVSKCSKLIKNLLHRQNICVEGRTLVLSIQWCLQALKIKDQIILLEVVQALEALLRNNPNNVKHLNEITNEVNRLLDAETDHYMPYLTLYSLQCLEACTSLPIDSKIKRNIVCDLRYELCANVFIKFFTKKHDIEEFLKCKILRTCMLGIQNIILQHPKYLKQELGLVLGIVKVFMLYGTKSTQYIAPVKLQPSVLSIPEVAVAREAKGGKITKQRKHRPPGALKKGLNKNEEISGNKTSGYIPATTSFEDTWTSSNTDNPLRTSDSDFSDSEGSKLAKVKQAQTKVRQATLSLLYDIIKLTEKSVIFSYWTNFIPESLLVGEHNLLTSMLKDPSSKCRIAALNVIVIYLYVSKLYLSQAASSEKSSSFTPFCAVLALTIKQLHTALSIALKEISAIVLTQVLKCYAALVEATPFHKLPSGLITEVIRNVKPFIYYRDATVQVKALIVLGCVLAFEPVLPEVKEVMLKFYHINFERGAPKSSKEDDSEQFEYAEFSESEEENETDVVITPWLLRKCLSNLGVRVNESLLTKNQNSTDAPAMAVAPVKLESVQVLSAMSRNYFVTIMAPYLPYITKALEVSLTDKFFELRLHGGHAVEFIGLAIDNAINNEDMRDVISVESCFSLWQNLLAKSLPDLLQSDQPMLRAVGCDCLGSIGPRMFEQLPKDKQISCVVHLFSCTRDEDNNVRGAAVRAVAIYVLYPSLREDPGFILDTAESICRIFDDETLAVRTKALWSLGNLSDALVLNRKSADCEDIPENLLLKLLSISIKSTVDNCKVQMNAVRAIGNLMQLINHDAMKKTEFLKTVEDGFGVLTKNSNTGSHMKVRWNACYALGNAMKNSAFYDENNNPFTRKWQDLVFTSLMELVISFRNFKVRTKAALALSAPAVRNHYGNFYIPTWKALLAALENTRNIEDPSEYQHRDNLIDQICLSIAHLATLLTKEDLSVVNNIIPLYMDNLKEHMGKVSERLIPEKSTVLSLTGYSLKKLCDTNLTSEEMELVKVLTNVFAQES